MTVSALVVVVENVPAPPVESVFQKLLVPHVPVVLPKPAVPALESQYSWPHAEEMKSKELPAKARKERRWNFGFMV